ncbi:MAG: hypothetical protein ACRELT_04510 [Longimicrobiales bacterium]
MGIFRPSRQRSDGYETLGHRMTIFVIGAIVGLAGIASGTSWIIYIAVGILAVGVLLRVAQKRR